MNKNKDKKNKYGYFLDQCNKTPLSKEWRDIFGPIDKDTLKQFNYKVKNPGDFNEALDFVEILNEHLNKPIKYYDGSYKHFCSRRQIPDTIRTVIDEILNDLNFQLLIKKERATLKIPIETGLKLLDPTIYGEPKLTPQENKAINRLCLYTALNSNTWHKFFMYLLIYNYIMPITYLEIKELAELTKNKHLIKLLNSLFRKIKIIPLRKRQINLINKLLASGEKEVTKFVYRNDLPQNVEIEKVDKIISKSVKSTLRELLKKIYPKNRTLAKSLETIKRRRLRKSEKSEKILSKKLKEFEKEFPPSSPKSPKITIDFE